MKREPILKTYKLYIGGKFPRTESGRYFQPLHAKTKKPIANVSWGSRKDLREAVVAARAAFPGWSSRTAYNRGQILYRMGEMLEGRKEEFVQEIMTMTGTSKSKALQEVELSVDRLVWYAGWADKYQALFGTINPVALPYFNFTLPEPTGVVGIVTADEHPLLPLISQMAPVIVSGNTCVILASEKFPLSAITFAEVLTTSDCPGGVVNILTGYKNEILLHLAKHMDVQAIDYTGKDTEKIRMLQQEGAANVKRIHIQTPRNWFKNEEAQSPYWIQNFVEMKTTWHPVGV